MSQSLSQSLLSQKPGCWDSGRSYRDETSRLVTRLISRHMHGRSHRTATCTATCSHHVHVSRWSVCVVATPRCWRHWSGCLQQRRSRVERALARSSRQSKVTVRPTPRPPNERASQARLAKRWKESIVSLRRVMRCSGVRCLLARQIVTFDESVSDIYIAFLKRFRNGSEIRWP